MKGGVRIAAITTGPIGRGGGRKSGGKVLLVCVVGTLNGIEGVLSTSVTIDGDDATGKIIRMIKGSRFSDQVKVVALNGVAMAGLNVVDTGKLGAASKSEVLVITRHRPRPALLMRALRAMERDIGMPVKERVELLKKQEKSTMVDGFYVQSRMGVAEVKRILGKSVDLMRLSHLLSSGISRGESNGRI